jgi:Ca2+-binding EF-hand superfamily protein
MSFSHKPVERKKPRSKPPPSESQKRFLLTDDHDEDNLMLTEAEIEAHKEHQNRRAFSYLTPDAIRWMQKRRPAADSSAKNFIPPMRVLQLRSIFRGLDFDGSGEIDISELKDAVRFVAKADTGSGPPLIEKPEEIVELFESMDIDKNGTVDFDEFLMGMTSSSASGSIGSAKMANAFYDFANQHRRQTIVEKVTDTKLNTLERYDELRKLYNMKYLKDEPRDGTVEDIMKEMARNAAQQKKEMNAAAEKYRRAELNRARAAAIYFDNDEDGPVMKGRSGFQIEQSSKRGKFGRNAISNSLKNLTGDEVTDNTTLRNVERKIQRNMCQFTMDDEETFTPSLATLAGGAAMLGTKVHREAVLVRNDSFTKDRLLPPPLSQSKLKLQRVESARLLHIDKLANAGLEKKERKQMSGVAMANARRATMGMTNTSVGQRRTSMASSSGSLSSKSAQ